MRACPLCKSTYSDEVNVCPLDGSALASRPSKLEATATIAPPTGAMLPFASLDRAERSDGVPRPSRTRGSGRIVVENDAEKTRRDRPPRRPDTDLVDPPAMSGASAGGNVEKTSELEREDFSALISSGAAVVVEPPEARLGKVVGSYRLVEIIGRGGMGCVYRAEHVKLGRDVALKLLREDYAQRRDAVTRFFQEARAVNLIRHRNIVDVIDYVELDERTVFIIMELLAGQSLGRLMRGPLPIRRALAMMAQICDGLSAAHAVGIVHRDLKPDNIIVVRTPDGGDLVKILDFGVAKLADKVAGARDLTAAGSVIGTPAYMSPEQASGLQVDQRSDVYSLGAIMYELFTHEPLFRASTFSEFLRRHMHEIPVRPSRLEGCADIDSRLEAIIMRCLEKSPDARHQSALALRTSLLGLLSSLDTQQQPPPVPEAARARPKPSWAAPPRLAARPTAQPAQPPEPAPKLNLVARSDPDATPTGRAARHAERTDSPGDGITRVAVASDNSAASSQAVRTRAAASGGKETRSGARTGEDEWGPLGNTPLPEPVAFGTPSPYDPPTVDSLMPPSRPSPAVYDPPGDTEPTRSRGRLGLVVGVSMVLIAAAIAFLIPFLARDADQDALTGAPRSPEADQAAAVQAAAVQATPAPAATAATATAAAPEPIVTPGDPAEPTAAGASQATAAPLDDDDRPRPGHGARPDRRSRGREPAPAAAELVRVRIVSTPSGELHATGRRGPLCQTPCALTINPADGNSARRRVYIIKKVGYRDEPITIDLAAPPDQLQVDLKKTRPPASGDADEKEGEEERDPNSTFNPFGDSEAPED